jgi:hypothetical protein
MYKLLIFIGVFFLGVYVFAESRTDSLLQLLDESLARKDVFMRVKESKLDSLKSLKESERDTAKIFSLNKCIYDEYKTYQYDSAYTYAVNNLRLAEKRQAKKWVNQSKLDLSFIFTSAGLFKESVDILKDINKNELGKNQLLDYYYLFSRVYLDLNRFNGKNFFSDKWWYLGNQYLDSLTAASEGSYRAEAFVRGQQYTLERNYAEAQKVLQNYLDSLPHYNQNYSMVAATLSFVYSRLNQPEKSKQCIIKSALSDIHSVILENESLYRLAFILFEEGQTDPAYHYIKISLADANFYNARMRRVEIAKSLPIIENAFLDKLKVERKRLLTLLIFTTILAFVLLVAAIAILKQIKELRRSRKIIEDTNQRLEELNHDLLVTNRIKEEYIGHFLNVCSQYIDKLEHQNQLVVRKINAGQIETLLNIGKSRKVVKEEMFNLLQQFERVFFKLFPDFVSSFNSLFEEEDRILLKTNELMTPELRIFALIRLGVTDSSKIAKFLRYSVNTVYTYRTKVKNKSIIDRSEFETRIMEIGNLMEDLNGSESQQ